jgi:hypothetical protein
VEHDLRDDLGHHPDRGASKGPEAGDVRQDFNEQRLIYKCRLDPSVDNSGYAGVTRVVRNGGSARMDQDTLVIENASSVMLLTRIEYFPDYSDDKVEALRQAVEGSPRTMRPCWNGTARSSRKCSTASPWISAAPRNTACPPKNFCPISGRGRTFRPRCWRRYSKWAAIGSSSPAASIRASPARPTSPSQTPVWSRPINSTIGPANGRRRAGRPARRHGGLLQLDGEPGPGLPGQRQEHLRFSRRVVSPLSRERNGRQVLLLQQLHDWRPLALLDFRRRLACARSGTTTWPPATRISSATASCRPIKNWRCSTRIS